MDNRVKHSLKSPEESSNIISRLIFGWTIPIFWKGARQDLEITDIYDPLKVNESERLGDNLEREWEKELRNAEKEFDSNKDGTKTRTGKPSLTMALLRVLWLPYMFQGLLILIQSTTFYIMQPIFQGWVISYFNPGSESTQDEVLLHAGFLIIAGLGVTFLNHHTTLRCKEIGMRARVACCSLIYRKVLRLNQTAVSDTAAGQVANLISNDVARFDMVPVFLHHIWVMPIQVCLIGYVMWLSVSVATFVGIAAMLIQSIPLQVYLTKVSAQLRSKIAVKTDERVQLMSELISGIQVVKMYSWEKPFEVIVSAVRALEIKLITLTSQFRGFNLSISVFCERITLYLTLITYVLMGNSLTAETTFLLFSLFSVMQLTCALYFPHAITMAGEAKVSLDRLTEFLLLDEVKGVENMAPVEIKSLENTKKPPANEKFVQGIRIEMVKLAANWVYGRLPPTLCDVSIEIKNKSLCAIVGSVASGKSSLLHILLGELPVGAGRLSFSTGENNETKIAPRDVRISYSSQDLWLFSASIRENILFGQPYDRTRYQEVTRVCALHRDFEQLPQGDLSFVGERGASLSGGQRARVNLARAVYRDAEVYLLDDPLSAVDAHVGRHLFEECITGFLKDKTRILVTHQLQYLPQVDSIVVLNRGAVESQGTYKELDIANLRTSFSESEVTDEDNDSTEDHKQDHEKTVTQGDGGKVPKPQDIVEGGGSMDVDDEEIAKGIMSNEVYWGYFLAGGNMCVLAGVLLAFIAGQTAASGTDYWVTYWTNQETTRSVIMINASYLNESNSDPEVAESFWFDEFGLFRPETAIYVYTFCIVGCIILVTLRSLLFIKMSMNASRNIHNSMFENLVLATMRFFNTNPSGRILNHFSKDVGAMDELLPKAFLEALHYIFVMIGILCNVGIVNPWMVIPMVVMIGILYVLRIYYLKTAQDIKRLEGIAKSPVFSQVSSTLDGLTTIRSRGVEIQEVLRKEFDGHQDAHTGSWYLTIATATAFGFVVDLFSCCFVACVCFSFILMDDGTTFGGSVGLAISQSLILTGMVQYGIKQTNEVVAQMTSVERVLQYTNLPKEGPFTSEKPPPLTWPSKGRLVFKDVTMRYADNKPPVLKHLNLDIEAGWKIGIVGRTGAGKSSLISALFRLTGDGLDGEIVLDGIDTKSIGLHELRPCIAIIPQEPILFSASLRYNLDPFEQYSDAELWNSLREVELEDAVPSLDFRVAGGGANFSVGQRQLICLARAILKNNRILVLDEATANVDRQTDALIQRTIRRRFANCTVLTIAHRLNTIMDCDRVLVMGAGCALEFDHPHILLKNPESNFSQMLQQTGMSNAEKLAKVSEIAFRQSPEYQKEATDI